MKSRNLPVVLGITGASGAILAIRAIEALALAKCTLDVVISRAAFATASHELGKHYGTLHGWKKAFSSRFQKRVRFYSYDDFFAPLASGTYETAGMLIIPCSMTTCAAIASGLSDTLLRRAADVTIKERRPLVIVPRETPLSQIHLENLLKLSKLGVSVVMPCPAWYLKPKSLEDAEKFIAARAIAALGIEKVVLPRWKGG
jgi:flavin prenyltransferase